MRRVSRRAYRGGPRIVAAGLLAAGVLFGACAGPRVDHAADVAALVAIHKTVLTAHLEGKIEPWMATEADKIVQANNGVISFPEKSARAAGRADYLARTHFTVYRDLREPIVTVSADGTLGWLLAEVETKGTQRGDDGVETPIADTWAWIELYEKQAGGWRGVGNVSNRRPPAEAPRQGS